MLVRRIGGDEWVRQREEGLYHPTQCTSPASRPYVHRRGKFSCMGVQSYLLGVRSCEILCKCQNTIAINATFIHVY